MSQVPPATSDAAFTRSGKEHLSARGRLHLRSNFRSRGAAAQRMQKQGGDLHVALDVLLLELLVQARARAGGGALRSGLLGPVLVQDVPGEDVLVLVLRPRRGRGRPHRRPRAHLAPTHAVAETAPRRPHHQEETRQERQRVDEGQDGDGHDHHAKAHKELQRAEQEERRAAHGRDRGADDAAPARAQRVPHAPQALAPRVALAVRAAWEQDAPAVRRAAVGMRNVQVEREHVAEEHDERHDFNGADGPLHHCNHEEEMREDGQHHAHHAQARQPKVPRGAQDGQEAHQHRDANGSRRAGDDAVLSLHADPQRARVPRLAGTHGGGRVLGVDEVVPGRHQLQGRAHPGVARDGQLKLDADGLDLARCRVLECHMLVLRVLAHELRERLLEVPGGEAQALTNEPRLVRLHRGGPALGAASQGLRQVLRHAHQ
mmetsp:Transcript_92888/g.239901  ORF Transcript_92888/g.239901 Transcript_92888/m.239901 type:complete len:431 (-) Transcript_92888:241-1533(-)